MAIAGKQGWCSPPGRTWLVTLATAAVLAVAAYWMLSALLHPGEPLTVHALYRYGDPDWFPMITHLGRLDFGDAIVAENLGRGKRAEPLVVCAIHAPLVRLFGAAGYVVADLLVPILVTVALLLLWRSARLTFPWAGLATFLALLSAFLSINMPAPALHLAAWELRLPRQFTETFWLALALAAFYHVCVHLPWGRWRPWLLVGALLGLALQVDFHSAFCLCLAVAAVVLTLAVVRRPGWRGLLRAGAAGALGGLLTVWPLLVENLGADPDQATRMGLVILPRWPPPWFVFGITQLLLVVLLPTAVLLVVLRRAPAGWHARRRVLLASTIVAGLPPFALPISVMILGRTISPDHFRQPLLLFSTLHLLLCLGYAVMLIQRRWRLRVRRLPRWIVPAVAALVLVAAAVHHHRRYLDRQPPFPPGDYPRWGGYRRDFAALTRELDRPAYRDVRVVASFDRLLQNWWVAFQGGCVFHPIYYNTTVPDTEIERRLMVTGHLMGLSAEEWASWLNSWPMVVHWLSGAKYQCSPLATWAPADAYPPEALAWCRQGDPFYPYNVLLPPAEWQRLIDAYRQFDPATEPARRLDLFVVDKTRPLPRPLPADRFTRVYENSTFAVYRPVVRR